MPKAKKNTNDAKQPSGYFSNIDEWPSDWMGVEEDLEIGRGLLALFIPFIQHLIDDGLASRVIRRPDHRLLICLIPSATVSLHRASDFPLRNQRQTGRPCRLNSLSTALRSMLRSRLMLPAAHWEKWPAGKTKMSWAAA